MEFSIAKIISGGQTGADRGGLDAAIKLDIPHSGWCPKGISAEDSVIPSRYKLTETSSPDTSVRTEQNVIDSDITVIFTYGQPAGGSKSTAEFAKKHGRPWMHIDLKEPNDEKLAQEIIAYFNNNFQSIGANNAPANFVVNVAGSRESNAPGIHERVKEIMLQVLKKCCFR